jgi:hypothetical protein
MEEYFISTHVKSAPYAPGIGGIIACALLATDRAFGRMRFLKLSVNVNFLLIKSIVYFNFKFLKSLDILGIRE